MFSKKKGPQNIFSGDFKKKVFKNFFQAKKIFNNFFSGDLYLRKPKKRSLQIFRKVSGVFQRNFNGSKILLSSSRGQGNFRTLETSRPRTSKCVLEAKDVLEDSTSDSLPAPWLRYQILQKKLQNSTKFCLVSLLKQFFQLETTCCVHLHVFLGWLLAKWCLNVLLLCFSSFVAFRATFSYYHDYERNV